MGTQRWHNAITSMITVQHLLTPLGKKKNCFVHDNLSRVCILKFTLVAMYSHLQACPLFPAPHVEGDHMTQCLLFSPPHVEGGHMAQHKILNWFNTLQDFYFTILFGNLIVLFSSVNFVHNSAVLQGPENQSSIVWSFRNCGWFDMFAQFLLADLCLTPLVCHMVHPVHFVHWNPASCFLKLVKIEALNSGLDSMCVGARGDQKGASEFLDL